MDTSYLLLACVVMGTVCCSPHLSASQPDQQPAPTSQPSTSQATPSASPQATPSVSPQATPSASPQATPSASPQPHIVLMVADDLGWNDVSWHNPTVLTPNLESLAKGGVLLEQSYVQPICTPTRSALLTGRYPFTLGRQHGVLWPMEPTGLELAATLLPQSLKQAGYSTHAVGKWHLGFCSWLFTPTSRGFDTFYGYYTGAEDYYKHVRRPSSHPHHDTPTHPQEEAQHVDSAGRAVNLGFDFRNNTQPDLGVDGTYSTYLFASYIEDLLRSRSSQEPMFLYLPFQSVHSPLQVPDNYTRPYSHIKSASRRIKLGMVTAMDEAVGRVVASLKATGHYDNSIIVFTTDNGGPTVSAGNNWPLRGNKSTLWEGGTRGPAFVHSPLLPRSGQTSHQLVHVTDWFPTLAGVGGGQVPPQTDGVDQWGALRGDSPPPRTRMIYNIDSTTDFEGGVRIGDYKLLVGNPGPGEWTPPPEGLSATFDQPTTESSSTPLITPGPTTISPGLDKSRQLSARERKKWRSLAQQKSFSKEITSSKVSKMKPNTGAHQETAIFRNRLSGSTSQMSTIPQRANIYNHLFSENSIFYDQRHQENGHLLDHPTIDSRKKVHNDLGSQAMRKTGNERNVSLAVSNEANGMNIQPVSGSLEYGNSDQSKHLKDSSTILPYSSSMTITQRLGTEFWTRFHEQELMSGLARMVISHWHQNNGSATSWNTTEPNESDYVNTWNYSVGENTDESWELEKEMEEKAVDDEGISNITESDKIEEQIQQILKLLGSDTSKIRLYNLAVDPEERHNVAESQGSMVRVLLEYLVHQLPRYVKADIPPDTPAGNPKHFGNIWTPGWCDPETQ